MSDKIVTYEDILCDGRHLIDNRIDDVRRVINELKRISLTQDAQSCLQEELYFLNELSQNLRRADKI